MPQGDTVLIDSQDNHTLPTGYPVAFQVKSSDVCVCVCVCVCLCNCVCKCVRVCVFWWRIFLRGKAIVLMKMFFQPIFLTRYYCFLNLWISDHKLIIYKEYETVREAKFAIEDYEQETMLKLSRKHSLYIYICIYINTYNRSWLPFSINPVSGVFRDYIDVIEGNIIPCLKIVRTILDTWNLARKYTHIRSFGKFTF